MSDDATVKIYGVGMLIASKNARLVLAVGLHRAVEEDSLLLEVWSEHLWVTEAGAVPNSEKKRSDTVSFRRNYWAESSIIRSVIIHINNEHRL